REVEEDLAARTARARVRHLPEIVVRAETIDPRVREAGDFPPQLARLVILLEYRNPQVRGRQLQLFGDELPGEADRVALEVIAKGKVSEHLEEGVMPRGVADLLEVIVLATRSDALLHRGRASSTRRLLLPEKYSLELHHARVGKHQRRVVRRHHRRARVDDV